MPLLVCACRANTKFHWNFLWIGIRRDGSCYMRPRDPIWSEAHLLLPAGARVWSRLVLNSRAKHLEKLSLSANIIVDVTIILHHCILNPFAPLYSLQRDLQNYIHIWYILKLFYTTINLCWICNHNICTTCVSICIIFYKFVYFSRQGSIFKFYLHHCIFLQQYLQYKIHFDMFWNHLYRIIYLCWL